MRDLKEILEGSLLDEIENTLQSGDDVIKKYKQAEKDWKKLLKSRRFAHSYGDQYIVKVISPELVEYFGRNLQSYKRWDCFRERRADLLKISPKAFAFG